MAQQYTNWGESTLAAPIAAGDLSLTVSSAATFPATGDFYINLNDGVSEEICRVTAVVGAVFTIVRAVAPSVASGFGVGTIITEVWTADALTGLRADMFGAGAYAGAPAAVGQGRMYLASDGPGIIVDNGAALARAVPMTWGAEPPAVADWTAFNNANLTVGKTNGVLSLSDSVDGGGGVIHGIYQAAPATPYTISFCCRILKNISGGGGYSGFYFGFRRAAADDFAVMGMITDPSSFVFAQYEWYTDPNTRAGFSAPGFHVLPAPNWFRFGDDGVNVAWSYSIDGLNWTQLQSQARATNLGGAPDQIVLALNPYSAGLLLTVSVFSWIVG